jgi:hypothetical protein
VDLDSVATKLYGELPEAFTASRSAEVRAARNAGDRQLAAAVAQLRRPTIGAWLANQLSRECQDDVAALLDLGASMRRAQEAGDGQELRDLTRQRRQMVAALLSEAKKLARARNQPLSENSTRELENTLEAAVATADAADALRAGRLNAGLTYSGFGPLDLGAPDVTEPSTRIGTRTQPSPASKRRPRPEGSKTPRPRPHDEWSTRKLDLAEAERIVKSAEGAAEGTQRELHDIEMECDTLRSEIVDAERHLRETKASLKEAERRLVEAKHADKMAKKEAIRAQSQRNKAEAASLHQAMSTER